MGNICAAATARESRFYPQAGAAMDSGFCLQGGLEWVPGFRWATIKGRVVAVRGGGRAQTVAAIIQPPRIELADNRQLIIFPEGTRRPAGSEPRYKIGVVHLYMAE